MSLHPVVRQAAEGRLPQWAVVGDPRRAHMARVADLLSDWGEALGLEGPERVRWTAAGQLHDLLRDERPDALRSQVPAELRGLPDPLLHGPAAAERLRREGVEDGELLQAVRYHTLGHPRFRRLGRTLYAADFLEPGRDLRNEWRGRLRSRMPEATDEVVREITAARLAHQLGRGGPLRPESVGFWNALVEPDA